MLSSGPYSRSLIGLPIALFVLIVSAQERSVSEGINERFTGTELNTTRSAENFENENREVFARRHDVIEAIGIEPGMAVADVGAGSGFYVEIMAAAVGAEGEVYAVEIAPNWIDYLNEKVAAEDLENVNVVRGGERSIELPNASIDLALSWNMSFEAFSRTSNVAIFESFGRETNVSCVQ